MNKDMDLKIKLNRIFNYYGKKEQEYKLVEEVGKKYDTLTKINVSVYRLKR